MGDGLNGGVRALSLTHLGDVLAGGTFSSSGTTPINNLARWDGTAWHPVGKGVENGSVRTIQVLNNGNIIVGGTFDTAGGEPSARFAEFGCVDACYPDCDSSGSLNIFDYICFGNAFGAGEPYADCDGNGSLNTFDYICFGNAYTVGCP